MATGVGIFPASPFRRVTSRRQHTLKSYGIPARGQELDSCVQRAQDWLTKAQAETNEERVHQLLGLAWAGEKPAALKNYAEALMREQRSNGGWGQLAGLDSDAYATGQSLYALMEAGKVSANDPRLRRGSRA